MVSSNQRIRRWTTLSGALASLLIMAWFAYYENLSYRQLAQPTFRYLQNRTFTHTLLQVVYLNLMPYYNPLTMQFFDEYEKNPVVDGKLPILQLPPPISYFTDLVYGYKTGNETVYLSPTLTQNKIPKAEIDTMLSLRFPFREGWQWVNRCRKVFRVDSVVTESGKQRIVREDTAFYSATLIDREKFKRSIPALIQVGIEQSGLLREIELGALTNEPKHYSVAIEAVIDGKSYYTFGDKTNKIAIDSSAGLPFITSGKMYIYTEHDFEKYSLDLRKTALIWIFAFFVVFVGFTILHVRSWYK
ncbi:MAG: hypothetical protein OEM52_01825 [bacterium]|nr:hypothetical protein [bacterium]